MAKGYNALGDEGAEDKDEATQAEKDDNGQLHLFSKIVNKSSNDDTGSHCTKTDDNS